MIELSDLPDNDTVHWDGTRFGLLPSLSEDAEALIAKGSSAIPILLEAISDPSLFITAHVLLTKITGIQYEAFPTWNGLEIDLNAKGEVSINKDQRGELARRWTLFFQTSPRPNSLPP